MKRLQKKPVRSWLLESQKENGVLFNGYCILAAFSTYFCMYGFRKPFSAGTFDGQIELPYLPDLDYKIVLVIAQVLGYMFSKFLGIKVVSELSPKLRARAIVLMIAFAELALLAFAAVPKPYDVFFLFLNGMPLGMVWGLVFGFLEGRRSSELLGAGLSISYIVASGAVKSVGRWVLTLGVSETWMPFVTGLLFFPFLLFFVYMLSRIPAPTAEDEKLRTARVPMDRPARRKFFAAFAPGLLALTALYMFLTAYRDFRDNFAREIWDALGYGDQPAIFTASEIPIAIAVLGAMALIMKIRDNRRALVTIHAVMLAGTALIGLMTLGFEMGLVSPVVWMISVGFGCYVAYVPYGCVLFDRLIAATGFVGTAGFMIYVTDAFGYLGSVGLMLYRNFATPNLSWLNFFIGFSYATAVLCTVSFVFSWIYFQKFSSAGVAIRQAAKARVGTAPAR